MVAVLTPDAPDVLSHVSVRARNMKVLFATCHDPKPLDDIRAMAGAIRGAREGRRGKRQYSSLKMAALQVKA